jgi:hypothetical protein
MVFPPVLASLLLAFPDVLLDSCPAVVSSVAAVLSAVNFPGVHAVLESQLWLSCCIVGITVAVSVPIVGNIPSPTGVTTHSEVLLLLASSDVPVVSCAAVGRLLLRSYCCCFVSGVPEVVGVSAHPAPVEISSVLVFPTILAFLLLLASLLLLLVSPLWVACLL